MSRIVSIVMFASLAGAPALAQQTDLAGRLFVPPGYDTSRAWPVVVLLPYTFGTAGNLYRGYAREAGGEYADIMRQFAAGGGSGFLTIVAAGTGSPGDYATGEAWSATILRYDSAVAADVRTASRSHRIDTTRIVLAGFSLGGDLSWAIVNRQPMRYAGALVMGSRASYRGRATAMSDLARRGTRVAIAMADGEAEARLTGARAAVQALNTAGVAHRLELFPAAGHAPAPLALFTTLLTWILWPTPPASPPR